MEFTVSGTTIQNCYAMIPKTIQKQISKKDLTREGLNNYCECIRWCDFELYRKAICYENREDIFIEEDWKKIDNLVCSSYKCGDYLVEVT